MTKKNQFGYATVTLMVFVVIGLTVTAAATTIIMINSLGASKVQQGVIAYDVAESGIENGVLRILRDPADHSALEVTTDNGNAEVSFASGGGDTTIITSEGTAGNFIRKIEAQVSYSTDLTITSWKEIN